MMTAGTLARWLTSTGVVDYRPVEAGGDCYITAAPADPDACVTVTDLGGTIDRTTDNRVNKFQLRFRGASGDVVTPRDQALAAAESLLALGTTLPTVIAGGTSDEARVVLVMPGAPGLMGQDEQGRYEWVLRVTVRSSAPSML